MGRKTHFDIDQSPAPNVIVLLLWVIALVASGLPAPAVAATSGETCWAPESIFSRGYGWTTTKTPEMAEHYYGQSYTAGPRLMAVDPYRENEIFVANQSVIARSDDRGCTWKEVWEIPEIPTTEFPFARGEYAAITSLEVTGNRALPRRVYAALWTSSPLRVHVIRSDDDGDTWKVVDDAVPWAGTHPRVRIAPSAPDVVYLNFRLHATGATVYYGSRDGGQSWTLRSTRPGGAYPAFGSDFRVDPVRPAKLWEWDRDPDDTEPIRRSHDGGRTWGEVKALGRPAFPQFVDVFHRRGHSARIVAVNGDRIYRSADGGRSWKRIRSPHFDDANLLGVVHGNRATSIALVACHAPYCWVFRFKPRAYREGRFPWIDIMPKYAIPPSFPSTSTVFSTRSERPSLLFNTGNGEPTTIERYRGKRWR